MLLNNNGSLINLKNNKHIFTNTKYKKILKDYQNLSNYFCFAVDENNEINEINSCLDCIKGDIGQDIITVVCKNMLIDQKLLLELQIGMLGHNDQCFLLDNSGILWVNHCLIQHYNIEGIHYYYDYHEYYKGIKLVDCTPKSIDRLPFCIYEKDVKNLYILHIDIIGNLNILSLSKSDNPRKHFFTDFEIYNLRIYKNNNLIIQTYDKLFIIDNIDLLVNKKEKISELAKEIYFNNKGIKNFQYFGDILFVLTFDGNVFVTDLSKNIEWLKINLIDKICEEICIIGKSYREFIFDIYLLFTDGNMTVLNYENLDYIEIFYDKICTKINDPDQQNFNVGVGSTFGTYNCKNVVSIKKSY